jgi:hypothetical protein
LHSVDLANRDAPDTVLIWLNAGYPVRPDAKFPAEFSAENVL